MDKKQEQQLAFVNALKALDFEKEYQQALRDIAETVLDMSFDYLVYDRFIIPVGLHYYGITDNIKNRYSYNSTAFKSYLDEYGWENITTTIVAEGLTKKEAELLEDKLIREGWERGDCINIKGSGGERRDNKPEYDKQYYKEHKDEYSRKYQERKDELKIKAKTHYKEHKEELKQYREEHKEHKKEYDKKRYSTTEGKIYNRVQKYNRNHTPIETPLEAKNKYLEYGYIPSYIKNDDLPFDNNEVIVEPNAES